MYLQPAEYRSIVISAQRVLFQNNCSDCGKTEFRSERRPNSDHNFFGMFHSGATTAIAYLRRFYDVVRPQEVGNFGRVKAFSA